VLPLSRKKIDINELEREREPRSEDDMALEALEYRELFREGNEMV
jgi:hypothetical protein